MRAARREAPLPSDPRPDGPAPARREIGLVVILGLIALAVLAFVHLGGEVGEGETRAFDEALLLALRRTGDVAQPVGPHWLQVTMLDFTALGGTSVLTLLTVLAVGFLAMQRRWGRAAFLVLATSGGALLSFWLKANYARPRPTLVAHLVEVVDPSFPSGHAMNSAIIYLTLGVLLARAASARRLKAYLVGVAMLLTLLVGCSRVYLGVHYPTDVLAGWTVGAAWAALCWAAAEAVRRRGALPT